MPEKYTQVRFTHPLCRTSLSLKRTPRYLRFTFRGLASCSQNWDALDQLEDTPEEWEQLFAGKLTSRGTMHLDRVVNGRRVGEWHATAEYTPIDPQPTDDVMRDRAKWQRWCLEQEQQALKGEANA